jgi:hypothetical protein
MNEALCYQPVQGFETKLGNLILTILLIIPAALYPGIYSASNRKVYQREKE